MSTDSLIYAVLLFAALALAALGWASYLLCALRWSRRRSEAAPPGVDADPPEVDARVPSWSWRSAAAEDADALPVPEPVQVAPPVRAAVFEPDRADAALETGSADERPPEWHLDSHLDERLQAVTPGPSGDDRPAWL